jgi:hypothetical protein
MLTLMKISNDVCCGFGVDQSVYNLQFTNFGELQNHALQTIAPSNNTVIVDASNVVISGFRDRWDPNLLTRTALNEGIHPLYMNVATVLSMDHPPQHMYFFAYPNFNNQYYLDLLLRHYTVASRIEVHGTGGHRMQIIEFTRKSS